MEPGQKAPKLKEIYAHHGYAMFLAQALEGVLVQAIYSFVIFPSSEEEITDIVEGDSLEEWDQFIDNHEEMLIRKSMGALFYELKNNSEMPENLEANLKSALAKRNFLAHEFYKEYLASFYSEQGQDNAIKFLQESAISIQNAIDILNPLVRERMENYGYDKKHLEEFAKNKIKEAKQNL